MAEPTPVTEDGDVIGPIPEPPHDEPVLPPEPEPVVGPVVFLPPLPPDDGDE